MIRCPEHLRTVVLVAGVLSATGAGRVGAQTFCNGGATSGAASCTATLSVQASTNYVAKMVLSSASTTLTAPTAAAFGTATGVNTTSPVTLTVNSNATHTITAAAAASNFSGGSGIKPASSLKYSTDNFATLKTVAGSGSGLVTSAPATASQAYSIRYNTTYAWLQDSPGTYTLAVKYTLTAP